MLGPVGADKDAGAVASFPETYSMDRLSWTYEQGFAHHKRGFSGSYHEGSKYFGGFFALARRAP